MSDQCVGLWIGPELGLIERACLRSVLRQGHSFRLYCYAEPAGVPHGVELADAEQILPRSSIIRHKTGSVALFSNRFRYELQRRGLGIWLDLDAYLIAPLDTGGSFIMGEFEPGRVATGVLRLPPDCPILPELLAIFDEASVPHWLPTRARFAAGLRLLATGRSGLSKMPWGSAGPLALTALAAKHGLLDRAVPPEVYYPLPWQDAARLIEPVEAIEALYTPRTVSIHLWNERIKAFKHDPAPRGSFLERVQQEGRAEDEARVSLP